MSTENEIFEIHQGEWSYLLSDDVQETLATANVAQCTVFFGGSECGFVFMFHHDLPIRPLNDNKEHFLQLVDEHVKAGCTLYCNLSGGWHYLWSRSVRRIYSEIIKELEDRGYKVIPHEDEFITGEEPYKQNEWIKGVAFSKNELRDVEYSKKPLTSRKRPLKAYIPFCELQLARPKSARTQKRT